MAKKKNISGGNTNPINLNKLLKEDDSEITVSELKPLQDKDIEWVSVYELARRLFAKGFTGWGKDRLQMHGFRFNLIRWTPCATTKAKIRRGRGRVTLNYQGMLHYIEFLAGLDGKFIPLPIPPDNHIMFSMMQFCMRYSIRPYMVYGTPAVSIPDWLMVVNYLVVLNATDAIDIEEPVHWEDVFQHHAKALQYKMFYAVNHDYSISYEPSKATSVIRAVMSGDNNNDWRYADIDEPNADEALCVKHWGYNGYLRTYIRVAMRASCGGDRYAPIGCIGWYCYETRKYLRSTGPNGIKGLEPIAIEQWRYAPPPKPKLNWRIRKTQNDDSAYTKTPFNYNKKGRH